MRISIDVCWGFVLGVKLDRKIVNNKTKKLVMCLKHTSLKIGSIVA